MAEDLENLNELERRETETSVAAEKLPLKLPFILTLAALIIYFAFQTLQVLSERSNLIMVKSSQEGAIQEAQKVQAQFKTLVDKTNELAEQGHAGARMVMEELFQRGAGPAAQAAPSDTKSPGNLETKPAK